MRIVCNQYGSLCVGGSLSISLCHILISTPSVDQINIAGYGDSIHSADVRFTINEDGSVGDIEVVKSSGVTALDEALVEKISTWRFTPATDSNGNPVASSKTEYIDFRN